MKRLTFLFLFALACNRAETPQQQAAPAPPDPRIESGRTLVAQYGCTTCHVIPGVEGGGALGPSLAGIGARPTISNGAVQNTPDHLRRFIINPQSLSPQSSMPPIYLPEPDARDITAFLLTLR